MDSVKLRVNVIAKTPAKEKPWYPYLQGATRFLMMVRNVSVSYRNTFAMSLPGFLPNVGDMLGQRTGGGMQPGLDFAFGLTGGDCCSTMTVSVRRPPPTPWRTSNLKPRWNLSRT